MNFLGRQPHLQPPPQQQLLPLPQQRYGFQTQILNIYLFLTNFNYLLYSLIFDYNLLKIYYQFIIYQINHFYFIFKKFI